MAGTTACCNISRRLVRATGITPTPRLPTTPVRKTTIDAGRRRAVNSVPCLTTATTIHKRTVPSAELPPPHTPPGRHWTVSRILVWTLGSLRATPTRCLVQTPPTTPQPAYARVGRWRGSTRDRHFRALRLTKLLRPFAPSVRPTPPPPPTGVPKWDGLLTMDARFGS